MRKSQKLRLVYFAGSLGPIAVALAAQYILHWAPCHLCLLQRIPYLLVFAAGMLTWADPHKARAWFKLAVLGWLATSALGAFHYGIEQGWIDYHGGCIADTSPAANLEELRSQVLAAPRVSCNDVAGNFLGLSLAAWNAVTALCWIALANAVRKTRG